jgi:hypothetical protein
LLFKYKELDKPCHSKNHCSERIFFQGLREGTKTSERDGALPCQDRIIRIWTASKYGLHSTEGKTKKKRIDINKGIVNCFKYLKFPDPHKLYPRCGPKIINDFFKES